METNTIQPTVNPAAQQITITLGGSTPVVEATPISKEEKKETKTPKQDIEETPEKDGLAQDKVTKNADDLIPQIPYYSDPLFYEVANYFGLKQEDYDSAKNQLADIVEFVIRDINSNNIEDVVPRLRELEDSIQSPGWDERRYTNVHKYIRLADKRQTIEKMMKAYEKEQNATKKR